MEGNVVNKILKKVKTKFSANAKNNNTQNLEYSFSLEELDNLERQNSEKIKNLKEKKKPYKKILSHAEEEEILSREMLEDDFLMSLCNADKLYSKNVEDEAKDVGKVCNSYVNPTEDQQNMVMDRWKNIDITRLDEDILKGKDILNHNYSITYGDDSLAYIYRIRDEYDILIEYLIGFNNEKRGIMDKTIFSDRLDNEWRYLNNYIKVLEEIRKNKK